jgi:hypothetical protein
VERFCTNMGINRPVTMRNRIALRLSFLLVLLVIAFSISGAEVSAQSSDQLATKPPIPSRRVDAERTGDLTEGQAPAVVEDVIGSGKSAAEPPPDDSPSDVVNNTTPPQFRAERIPVAGGAELLTIFGRLDGLRSGSLPAPEVPLLSVARDTLGDNDPENDRLRYVWMLTYTEPTLLKRIASAIPFLYQRVGNKSQASPGPPRPILDFANSGRQTWNRFFWSGLQNIFLDSYGIPLKAASRSYRRNASDYRSAHVTQALAILTNYETLRQRSRDESELLARRQTDGAESSISNGEVIADSTAPLMPEPAPAFTIGEMLELRARLI